jgi:hypothetical protein
MLDLRVVGRLNWHDVSYFHGLGQNFLELEKLLHHLLQYCFLGFHERCCACWQYQWYYTFSTCQPYLVQFLFLNPFLGYLFNYFLHLLVLELHLRSLAIPMDH